MKPLSVSKVNTYIGRILQTDPILGNITVFGEISNLTYHSSGHVYFNLKDDKSTLRCFMAYTYAEKLRYVLENGMEVTASGYISVYERGGTYSLNVKLVEAVGQGSLDAAFKALKEKLEKEGLFDQKYKKPIPAFPKCIGVVTSPTGAAVRDIIKIVRSRNKLVDIIVFPCMVQGESSAGDIARTVDTVNEKFKGKVDVMIVGRGGGSAEDLWSFNEEVVARSIFRSEIPVISAVGHETDFSISDFAADVRAETPTAAAAIAAPDLYTLREELDYVIRDMRKQAGMMITSSRERIERFSGREFSYIINTRIGSERQRLAALMNEIKGETGRLVQDLSGRLENYRTVLETTDPRNVMLRGYAAVSGKDGSFLRSVNDIKKGDTVDVWLSDGRVAAEVISKDEKLITETSAQEEK